MDPILQPFVVLFKYHYHSLLVNLNTLSYLISITIMNQFLFLYKLQKNRRKSGENMVWKDQAPTV
jgi:hypothetical protein